MNKIYAGAHLTIIAAADNDHYEQNTRHSWGMFETKLYPASPMSVSSSLDLESSGEKAGRNHHYHLFSQFSSIIREEYRGPRVQAPEQW
jgi:hypothetical protein